MNPADERIHHLRHARHGHEHHFDAHGHFPRPHGRRGHRDPGLGFGPMGPGDFPFGPDHGRGRGRGRQRRGDMRAAVLALLAERPLHGYEIIREVSERSQGRWRPSPGSVYPLLQQLADEELIVESGSHSSRGGKKSFALTEHGTQAAESFVQNPPWEQLNDELGEIELAYRKAFGQLVNAVRATAEGSDDQKRRAIEIINGTRRKLYGILSEDDTDSPPQS